MKRIFLAIVFVSLFHSDAFAQPETMFEGSVPTCEVRFGPRNQTFAHCPSAVRDFETAIIAIHGWNGACSNTFGKLEASLFSVLDDRRFYDWDCFDYKSHSWKISESTQALKEQIETLKTNGYKDILFITHSTGGIIFLEYLLDLAMDADGNIRSDAIARMKAAPRIHEASVWAAPVYGIRWHVGVGANVLDFWRNFDGTREETLPDLKSDSTYLRSLRTRISKFRIWQEGLSLTDQKAIQIQIKFLQGMSNDWVVEAIPSNPVPEWLGPKRVVELVPTELPHTSSVNESGTAANPENPAVHKLPGVIADYVAITSAPFSPRIQDIFFKPVASSSAEARQDFIISGLSYYVQERQTGAVGPAMRLLVVLYNLDAPHYQLVDERLVDELIGLLNRNIEVDPAFPEQALAILKKIRNAPLSVESARSFGHGRSSIAKKVLELIEAIKAHVTSTGYLYDDVSPGTSDTLQIAILDAELSILESTRFTTIRDAAIAQITVQIPQLSERALLEANLMDRLVSGYYAANANDLPPETKFIISGAIEAAIGRGDGVAAQALKNVVKPSPLGGSSVPVWQSLGSQELTRKIQDLGIEPPLRFDPRLQEFGSDQSAIDSLIEFNTNVIRGVGYSGNDFAGARTSLEILKGLDTDQQDLRDRVIQYDLQSPLNNFNGSQIEVEFEQVISDW